MKLEDAREALNKHTADLIDLCPHCGAKAHIVSQWSDSHRLRNGDIEFYVIFRCKPCRKLILKTFFLKQNPYSSVEDLEIKGWDHIFPIVTDDQLSPEEKKHVTAEVLQDYEEALRCKSVAAYRASCAMFRRALQSALVVLGADPEKHLVAQINSLNSLPGDIKDWSHQIRIAGNWGAHPDKDQLKDVDQEDVLEAHDFFAKFLVYTFIMPAKVKASRERREAKADSSDHGEQPG